MEIQKMNKRGNVFLGVTFGIVIFIFGVLILNFFLDDIVLARTNLKCSSPALITSGTMLVCLLIDGLVPYYIWTFCAITIGFFMGRNK